MRTPRSFLLAAIACVGVIPSCSGQAITVRAVNGKTGAPLVNQRLVIFMFEDLNDRQHASLDAVTDKDGAVSILPKSKYLQIWPDFLTQCVKTPNYVALDVDTIRTQGLLEENTCSKKLALSAKPNEVTVFARPATLRERMAR